MTLDEIAEIYATHISKESKVVGLFLAEWERQRIVQEIYRVLNHCKARQEREMARRSRGA